MKALILAVGLFLPARAGAVAVGPIPPLKPLLPLRGLCLLSDDIDKIAECVASVSKFLKASRAYDREMKSFPPESLTPKDKEYMALNAGWFKEDRDLLAKQLSRLQGWADLAQDIGSAPEKAPAAAPQRAMGRAVEKAIALPKEFKDPHE